MGHVIGSYTGGISGFTDNESEKPTSEIEGPKQSNLR